jgi:hypothetical protein
MMSIVMGYHGNLMLNNKSYGNVWESYNNPIDTVIVVQVFVMGKTFTMDPYSFSFDSLGNISLKWKKKITYWNMSFL